MKVTRIVSVIGMITLLASGGAVFAQATNIPMGAGAGVERQPAGSRFRNPTNAQPAAPSTAPSAISASCSQQANAKGLHGKARRAFREKCKRNSGR